MTSRALKNPFDKHLIKKLEAINSLRTVPIPTSLEGGGNRPGLISPAAKIYETGCPRVTTCYLTC